MKKLYRALLLILILFQAKSLWAAQDVSAIIQKSLPGVANAEQDMALLGTAVPASEYKVLPLASQNPSTGVAAYAIGAPSGLDKTVSDGLVSQLRKIGE